VASKAIGRSIAIRLAEEGLNLVLKSTLIGADVLIYKTDAFKKKASIDFSRSFGALVQT